MHVIRKIAAAVAAAGLVLAAAIPASASTRPQFWHATPAAAGARIYDVGNAGYVASGAQFRFVGASAYLRNPANYASTTNGIGWGVTLSSAGWTAEMGVSDTTTSGTSYSPAFDVYQGSTLVSGPSGGTWCSANGVCQPMADGGAFAVGSTVRETLYYDQAAGTVSFSASDQYGNHAYESYPVGVGVSFTVADVGAGFGSFTAPPSAQTLFSLSSVALTTYTGHHSGLSSWWSHAKEIATSDGTASGAVQASPSNLSSSGASFSVSFEPAAG